MDYISDGLYLYEKYIRFKNVTDMSTLQYVASYFVNLKKLFITNT